ncbi:GTP-binding protein [Ooceraea biroi]|uniref:GTP-binding protein 1 n=1 Tax=Ooceraea biroi TaxID=2015173 RepID=A0A026WDU7_OOCBI|nr:GTP-binding protein [Ooceraea biroi]
MSSTGSIISHTLAHLPEKEHGSISTVDYSSIREKNVLVSPSEDQYDLLLRRLKERIQDGGSETIFDIGIAEDGSEDGLKEDEYEASVATLQSLAATLEADCVLLRQSKVDHGLTGQYLVRRRLDRQDFLEIRVAVVGNVDAGKSTLLGVLTHGELDNGRGLARQKLFRHKHEAETGRTSSVGNDILGFDSVGNVVNKPEHGSLDWVKICEKSSKVITFIDLAGHERYLKTILKLLLLCMLMIGANAGIVGMTKEHLGLALALSVPVFVVVTKIDMCPPNVLQENLKLLIRILKSPGCRKVPVTVKTPDDVVVSATNFVSERLCPIFQVSNVSGENLNLLKMFLNLLTARITSHDDEPAEFQIDDTYSVPGVGTVVSGTTLKGIIKLNDTLLLGPDPLGRFTPIAVKSIHRKRMPVREVRGGQTASFALKKIKRSHIRKGMVMVAPALNPQACWEFEGEILVLHHPTTISSRYQAMVHCGSIRQTASILSMSQDCLRTGDKALVHFRFIKHPEYIKPGQRMVFREGRTKAVGNVVKLIPHSNNTSTQASRINKPNKTSQSRQSANVQTAEMTEADSMIESQTAKQENVPQKSGSNQNKKGRGRRGGRSHNSINSIQPLAEQNPPAKV